jgi:hypothetical protein
LWDFNAEVPVMIVYWSGTAIVAAPQTEFHGIRDNVWHLWAHNFLGLQYVSGLSFTGNVQTDNNTNPGANDTVQYLWSTSGVVQDEDFRSTPGTGQWLQTLGSGLTSTTAAIFNFFYFTGSAVASFAAMADRSPFIYSGVNGTPQWESAGTMTNSITGDYIVYHYFANPMVNGWSVFGRPHNAKFTSLATALAARPTQLTWTGYAELKHIYTAIWRVNTSWSTTHRCKLVSLTDWRAVNSSPSQAVAASSHASLSSLELAGSGVTWGHINDQAQTIAGVKTFEGGIKFSSEGSSLKFAIVTGITASSDTYVDVNHNITGAVISAFCSVDNGSGALLCPVYTSSANLWFDFFVDGTKIRIINKASNSTDIRSKTFKCVIFYT